MSVSIEIVISRKDEGQKKYNSYGDDKGWEREPSSSTERIVVTRETEAEAFKVAALALGVHEIPEPEKTVGIIA